MSKREVIAEIVAECEGLRQGVSSPFSAIARTVSTSRTLREMVQSPENMESARAKPKYVVIYISFLSDN
jgi:hypothetical protein